MTKWQEVDDLRLDEDDRDELDPMAAPVGGFGSEEPEDIDEELDLGEAGFTEPTSSVRIWTDEDGNLIKVRVSPSWRDRVGKPGLSGAFNLVFVQANNWYRTQSPAESMESDGREARQPLSWDSIYEVKRRNERIREQLADLGPEANGQWVGAEAVGVTPDKEAAVRLNIHGKVHAVEFNDKWLENARVKQITDAVMRAHQSARESFVPPKYEPGERDQLMSEIADNRNELLAMMRRGFK